MDLFVSYDPERQAGDRLAPEVVDEICLIAASDECGGNGGGGGSTDGAELLVNKGQPGGYAPLGSDGLVPAVHLPPASGGGAVTSVNSKTGAVVLTKADIGLPLADNTADATKAVLSATKLVPGRTINGVAFDGTADITVPISTDDPDLEAAVTKLINLNAGYKAPAIDVLGDSITSQCGGYRPVSPPSGTVYPAAAYHTARGYLFYTLTLLSNRIRPGVNFGISGQTTAQMKARLVDVLASPSPYVHVYAGINDLMQGFSTQTTKSNLLSIYTQLLEAGKTVTTATIGTALPISGAAVLAAAPVGATTFSTTVGADANDVLVLGAAGNTETVTVASAASTGTDKWTITLKAPTTKAHDVAAPFTNTTRIARLHDLNQWIVDYCQGRYADPVSGTMVVNSGKAPHLVDWHSLLADPANGKPFGALQPSGAITTVTVDPDTLVVDGTHPGQDLAHRMGQSLAVVLDRLVPPLPVQLGDNSDTSNLILNGRCVGTTAQGLATGFAIGSESGVGTVTATASKVPRTDGVPGEMQQVQIGPGNVTPFQLFVCDQRDMTFTGNDYFVAEVEFETDQNLVVTGAAGVPFCVRVYTRNGSALLDSARSPDFASAADGAGTMWPSRGVIKTLPLKVSATANRLQVMVLTQNVAAGTYRIKSARFRKVVMSPTVTTPGEATPVADDPAAVDPVEADAPANKTK